MFEHFVTGETLPEAYHKALTALHRENDRLPCPDYNTNQKEASMTFVVTSPLKEPMISKLFIGDPRALEQYRQEMLDGILDFEVARGNWEYTYHQRMADQIPWVIDELRRNPDSRRAVVSIRSEEDMHTGSPACLQNIHYLIRDGKLHSKVLFRSNDATKASFMNAFALIMLQKRIADALGIAVGTYTHRANSFHVYERDYNMFDGYIRRIESGGDVTFNYIGDWDELMDEAKPAIAEMVRQLKDRE
ncbi:thymidylate synthase [Sporobacter termitidis DSM 10068]|uniref:Thymidylate synthase n=1 Tax=Sporobacter termitidis DSM 10068 TaxID=1123282 RepID=A0A1M5U4G0_9FIRM|nr:thymidylate synthase [Sporobacter termitidis]SHH57573.1 thymidylate synthase [Sporobacter termitidis DSM 10068]